MKISKIYEMKDRERVVNERWKQKEGNVERMEGGERDEEREG